MTRNLTAFSMIILLIAVVVTCGCSEKGDTKKDNKTDLPETQKIVKIGNAPEYASINKAKNDATVNTKVADLNKKKPELTENAEKIAAIRACIDESISDEKKFNDELHEAMSKKERDDLLKRYKESFDMQQRKCDQRQKEIEKKYHYVK